MREKNEASCKLADQWDTEFLKRSQWIDSRIRWTLMISDNNNKNLELAENLEHMIREALAPARLSKLA